MISLSFARGKMTSGDWVQEVGDYEGALKVYQEAQEMFVALYGYEHSEVISAHEYMGLVRDPDKARGIFATAADIRCIVFWPGHELTEKSEGLVASCDQMPSMV